MRSALPLAKLLLVCHTLLGCSGEEGGSEPAVPVTDSAVEPGDAAADAARDGELPEVGAADATDGATPDAKADVATDTGAPLGCAAAAPCPTTPSGVVEGGGPRAIERCAFSLKGDSVDYATPLAGLTAALKKVSIADVLADLNRTATPIGASSLPGVPGFKRGFGWDAEDQDKAWWIPQGLTGSADATAAGTVAGKKVVAVTWYYDLAKHPGSTGEKGIRLSIADVTGATVKYRHLLLVVPKMAGARADFDPIDIHAGGVAWVGDRLWVADTGNGVRAFDMARILEVSTTKDSIGWDGAAYQGGLYKYVIPQVGFWRDASKCNPVFSFVALDRASTPPALITGEYVSGAITGRVLRWPVDATTGALSPTTWAEGAWVMAQRQVQGALTHDGAFYLSSSAPAGGKGVLYVTRPGKKTLSYPWVDAPEDVLFDTNTNQLWGAGEAIGKRWVFAVDAAAVKAP